MSYLIGVLFVCLLLGLWRPPQLRLPWLVAALVVAYVAFLYLHPSRL